MRPEASEGHEWSAGTFRAGSLAPDSMEEHTAAEASGTDCPDHSRIPHQLGTSSRWQLRLSDETAPMRDGRARAVFRRATRVVQSVTRRSGGFTGLTGSNGPIRSRPSGMRCGHSSTIEPAPGRVRPPLHRGEGDRSPPSPDHRPRRGPPGRRQHHQAGPGPEPARCRPARDPERVTRACGRSASGSARRRPDPPRLVGVGRRASGVHTLAPAVLHIVHSRPAAIRFTDGGHAPPVTWTKRRLTIPLAPVR